MPTPINIKDAAGDTKTIQSPIPGIAGTPSVDVNSVQGISGGVPVPSNVTQINGNTVAAGAGATTNGTQRVILPNDFEVVTRAAATGLGDMQAVPAGSPNGTALGSAPTNTRGFRIYLGNSDAITFTMATAAPSSAPSNTFTISGSGTGPNWDENIASGAMMYITAVTGTPKFRWY